MLSRNPRIFSALAVSVGIGLCGYYGLQWYQLPRWNEAEIEQSVQLNLEMDLQRMGPLLQPKGERLVELRRLVRSEIENEIRSDQRSARRGSAAGMFALLLGMFPVLGRWLKTPIRASLKPPS